MLFASQADRNSWSPEKWLTLRYSGLFALNAGFVNAVAILILAFPVGNVTAVTTQLGMNTANPLLYEGRLLAGIVLGFLLGAAAAGAILAGTQELVGARQATVMGLEAILLALVAIGIEFPAFRLQISVLGIEQSTVNAMLAAAALGMQNGLTSNFRGMAVRTTHFTGTVTDLGLMLGRYRKNGIDRWKAAVLAATLFLFMVGGIAGLIAGARAGGYALLVPAASCVALAAASLRHRRVHRPLLQERRQDAHNNDSCDDTDEAQEPSGAKTAAALEPVRMATQTA